MKYTLLILVLLLVGCVSTQQDNKLFWNENGCNTNWIEGYNIVIIENHSCTPFHHLYGDDPFDYIEINGIEVHKLNYAKCLFSYGRSNLIQNDGLSSIIKVNYIDGKIYDDSNVLICGENP